MDFGIISKVIGLLLLTESALMIPSLLIAFYNGEGDAGALVISIISAAVLGAILVIFRMGRKQQKPFIRYREGFMIVSAGWILASLFGALPLYLSGATETFIDAFFEIVSGFTTTGATILKDVEILPKGILFWRTFTHWLGGMGILVFTMALLPAIGMGSLQIFKAETTGPTTDKLTPKIGQTAKLLYGVYLILTAAQIIALKIAGMPLFDAFCHTFATVGTGGFSNYNQSIGYYNSLPIEVIITIFTFISGVNFSLYCDGLHGNFRTLLKDREFRFYTAIVVSAIILIAFNLTSSRLFNFGQSLRHASFQVVTIISTTGFSSTNFDLWPDFSKMILFLLMFSGACAGSTAGGIKVVRLLLVLKIIRREFYKLVHPKAVIAIRLGDKTVSEETLQSTMGFVLLYLLIFLISSMILLAQGLDFLSSTSAVAATLGNVGPGFALVGPFSNYSSLSGFTKLLLSVLMILGRLEIHTLLVIIAPAFWKK